MWQPSSPAPPPRLVLGILCCCLSTHSVSSLVPIFFSRLCVFTAVCLAQKKFSFYLPPNMNSVSSSSSYPSYFSSSSSSSTSGSVSLLGHKRHPTPPFHPPSASLPLPPSPARSHRLPSTGVLPTAACVSRGGNIVFVVVVGGRAGGGGERS